MLAATTAARFVCRQRDICVYFLGVRLPLRVDIGTRGSRWSDWPALVEITLELTRCSHINDVCFQEKKE